MNIAGDVTSPAPLVTNAEMILFMFETVSRVVATREGRMGRMEMFACLIVAPPNEIWIATAVSGGLGKERWERWWFLGVQAFGMLEGANEVDP